MPSFFRRAFPAPYAALLGVLAVSVTLFAGCGGSGDGSTSGDSDPVAYTVGNALTDSTLAVVVTSDYGADTLQAAQYRGQIRSFLQRMPPNQQSEDQLQQLHRNLVDQFVTRHVLIGEAGAEGIEADTARVNMQLRQMRSRFPNEQAFQQAMAASGMTEDSLRSMVAEQVRAQTLQEQMTDAAEAPTPEEIDAYRQEQQQEEVSARHILFRVEEGAPEDTVEAVRTRAEAILDSAQAPGADFAALARQYSEGPTSSRGGDLGYFTADRMVEPFSEAAYALADSGDVSTELVRTQYGFHIIQLTGRRMQEMMDTSQARQALAGERQQEAFEEGRDALLSNATVRINPDIVEADLQGSS